MAEAGLSMKLAHIKPFQKSLNLTFIVLEKGAPKRTKEQKLVSQCVVADETGSMNMALWDKFSKLVKPGDILRLRNGYCTPFMGAQTLNVGRFGEMEKIGEFQMLFSKKPNLSARQWAPNEKQPQLSSAGINTNMVNKEGKE